jgi:cytidyltransferase-like protein
MTPSPLRIGYLVGRFNPLQKGHLALLEQVHAENDRMVILVGSATESRTHKNPLSFEERKALLLASFPDALVLPLPDLPNDEEWVRLFEATLLTGLDSLQIAGRWAARMYSADATRADDYALRCDWVRRLGHSVVPFPPVKAPMDLSASLVRDRWYSGCYDEVKELVPASTFALLQQLNIGWMQSSYVKTVPTGAPGPLNRAYLAVLGTGEGVPRVLHLLHENGEFGWLSAAMADGADAAQVLAAQLTEALGLSALPEHLTPVSSHAVSFQGELEHAHLFVYRLPDTELNACRGKNMLAEDATVCLTRLSPAAQDVLRTQQWAGPGRDLLQALRYAGHLDAAIPAPSTTAGAA